MHKIICTTTQKKNVIKYYITTHANYIFIISCSMLYSLCRNYITKYILYAVCTNCIFIHKYTYETIQIFVLFVLL